METLKEKFTINTNVIENINSNPDTKKTIPKDNYRKY